MQDMMKSIQSLEKIKEGENVFHETPSSLLKAFFNYLFLKPCKPCLLFGGDYGMNNFLSQDEVITSFSSWDKTSLEGVNEII